jgi:hypothetical protein
MPRSPLASTTGCSHACRGNLEDEFDVMLGGASSIDVTSVPLDKNDSPVAPQASKTFDVR